MSSLPSSTVLLLLGLYAAINSDACDNVFIVQPNSSSMPNGTQVQLICSVNQEYGVRWSITLPNGTFSTADMDSVERLESEGIMPVPSNITANNAVLIFDGTQNYEATVVCVAVLLTNRSIRCSSQEARVMFYGPPPAPADLAATENGVESLNISWSLMTMEGEAVNFTVTVTNLNDSSTMEVSGIQYHHYIFNKSRDSTSCDVYSFQVTAVNGAGSGTPSEIINRSLPSLPVQDSLQHFLVRTASGVTLSVTFNGATSCPDYPVTNLTLVLLEIATAAAKMISLKETSDGVFMLEERELEENSQYLFHVIASNDVGAIQSAPVQIITTNVQDIDISKKEDTYFIQCIYLSGSDVSGCVYILMSGKEGVKNVTGFIERDSNGLEVANIGCYSEVLAHENITDVLPVSKIINTIIDTCTNGFPGRLLLGILMAIAGIFIIALVIVVVALSCYIHKIKNRNNYPVSNNDKSCVSEDFTVTK